MLTASSTTITLSLTLKLFFCSYWMIKCYAHDSNEPIGLSGLAHSISMSVLSVRNVMVDSIMIL